MKKELGLSPQKATRIDQIYQERSKRLAALGEEAQKQFTEMMRLRDERTVDEATYAVQVWRSESMWARFNADRTVLQYRLYGELTPEQYTKLREIRERDRGRGRGGLHQ